jgi:hypothetical protein
MKHLKHLKQALATCRFSASISLMLGRMEARQHVEFIGVELAGGVEIITLVGKVTMDLHTVPVEREGARGKLRCEPCMGEFDPGSRELRGVRSTLATAN